MVGARCSGLFWALPMSGSIRDDLGMSVLWWYSPPGMTSGSCDVMIYIPVTDRPQDAAGHPTYYVVLRGREDATVVGAFVIDQVINHGRWVGAGRYPLHDGQIAIKMTNRGLSTTDRHAAAQTWFGCVRQ